MKATTLTLLFLLQALFLGAQEHDLPDTASLKAGDWFDLEFTGDLGSGRIPFLPGDESFRGSIWMPDSLLKITFRCRILKMNKKVIILSAKIRRMIYAQKSIMEYGEFNWGIRPVKGYSLYDSWYPDQDNLTDKINIGKDSVKIIIRRIRKNGVSVQYPDSTLFLNIPFFEQGLKERSSFVKSFTEIVYDASLLYESTLMPYFDLWRMILYNNNTFPDTIWFSTLQYAKTLTGDPKQYYADPVDSSWFAVSKGISLPWVFFYKEDLWKVARITDASFPVAANVQVEYKKDTFPEEEPLLKAHQWEHEISIKPVMHTDSSRIYRFFLKDPLPFSLPGNRIFLMPGDSLVINEHISDASERYSGKGKEPSVFYSKLARIDIPKHSGLLQKMLSMKDGDYSSLYRQTDSVKRVLDALWQSSGKDLLPFWKRAFRKQIDYWYVNEYLTMKLNGYRFFTKYYQRIHIPWDDPVFERIDPLVDYLYLNYIIREYSEWCDRYFLYRKRNVLVPTVAPPMLNNEQEMSLSRILLRGYPMYSNYIKALQNFFWFHKEDTELFKKYAEEFLRSCSDPYMREVVKKFMKLFMAMQPGENIRDMGLYTASKLSLKKKAKGYILFSVINTASPSLSINNFYHNWMEKPIRKSGLDKNLKVVLFFPHKQKNYMDSIHLGDPVRVYYVGKDSTYHDEMKIFTDRLTFMLIRDDGVIVNNHVNDNNIDRVLASLPKRPPPPDRSALYRLLLIILLAVILSGGITWGVVRYRSRRMLRREEARRRLAELELRALRSQMNPHFLFNALNSIQNLINKNRIREANLYLARFATLMRMVLDHADRPLVSLDEELKLLKIYLELESLRTPFEYSIDVAPEVVPEEEEIPGMLLQPYVENAVLHGMVPARGGKITISVTKKDGTLRITIADNGQGIRARSKSRKGNGKAMKMIGERIRILNMSNASPIRVHVTDLAEAGEGQGTRVVVEIPV